MIRVMLVDDLRYARLGYRMMLSGTDDITIVGEAADGEQAITWIATQERFGNPLPDAILMDVRMPVMDGIRATRVITRQWPGIRVLILTTYDEDDYAFGGLDAGASGFLLKDATVDQIADAVHAVAQGDAVLTPRVTRQVLERGIPHPTGESRRNELRDSFDALTPRQREICAAIADGLSTEEIAVRLVIEPTTVRRAISRILATLHLRDRVQIAVNWYKAGL